MKNKTVELIWLVVEVLCVARSAVATFQVTMNISNGDTIFSAFTVGVVELSLFAMLLMSGVEAVAPIATLVLIAFSAVLQFAEMGVMTDTMDAQTKMMLRYAVSFAPTVLLLVGLVKRLTSENVTGSMLGDAFGGLLSMLGIGKRDTSQTVKAFDVPSGTGAGRVTKCSECGNEFDTARRDSLTCSAKCRKARARRLAKE